MGKDLVVPFRINDSNSKRRDRESTSELQKILKKQLMNTSWRLMSDGCNYRLGIVTGRLRAYEKEDDLLKLVRRSK
jgi:hypothetical protein